MSGVPLQVPAPSLLYTDTSMTDWDAHLLYLTAAGVQSWEEDFFYISMSEVKAIQMALNAFLDWLAVVGHNCLCSPLINN